MSFDWQTEEDGGWDDFESPSSGENEKEPKGSKRRWLWWLFFLVSIFGVVTVVGWTIRQRVEVTTWRVKEDILASHELAVQAIETHDIDLFQNILSGRDEAWAFAMEGLVAHGLGLNGNVWGRREIGLVRLPESDSEPRVEIAPDLQEAVVTALIPYQADVGNGYSERVMLAQTAVYRKGSNRWLLSPPDATFWGDTRRIQGQYIDLFYPERDKEIVQELFLSLDAKIGQLCAQFSDIDCPDDYQVVVELISDPAALAQLSMISAGTNAAQRHVVLPTPTLVGLPVDQISKEMLFRGYGQLVVGTAITDLWEYRCCKDYSMLYFALLNTYFRRLGLMPWRGDIGSSVITLDYDRLYTSGMPVLFSDTSFWNGGELNNAALIFEDRRADILAEFAQQRLGISEQELIQNLNTFDQFPVVGEWLLHVGNLHLSSHELAATWQNFVYSNTSLAQASPPAPFPDQDIQLLCQIGDEERMAFYRYDLAKNVTSLEQPLNRFADKMVALPDDNGLAVWEAGGDESLTQLFLWVDGEKVEISWDADETAPGPIPLHVDPTNSKLILAPAQFGQVNYGLLDVPSCLEDTCQLESLTGYPVWSPDLAHMILLHGTMTPAHEAHAIGQLTLADEMGEAIRPLDIGASPFWLDDERFGFVIEEGEDYRHMIVAGRVDDVADWDVLLTAEELTAVLGDDATRLIGFVSLDPQDPDQLIIVTMNSEKNEQTLFVYDLIREEVVLSHSFVVGLGRNQTYRFSPNGRFLLMSQYEFELDQQSSLFILDLAEGVSSVIELSPDSQNSVYWMTDFSQDGEWLLVTDENILYLSLPGSDYERLIFPETGACETAVFINKEN